MGEHIIEGVTVKVMGVQGSKASSTVSTAHLPTNYRQKVTNGW